MTRLRALLLTSLAAALVGTSLHAPPAAAAPSPIADLRRLVAEALDGEPIPVPPLVTEVWDGTTGVDATAERWRKAVADVAALSPEQEVRDAALAALATGDPQVILQFATVDKPALEKQVAARKKQAAADNLAKIKAMAGTGGASFNAEVQRVLAGTDGDREAFLAYGADIARARDQKIATDATERATQLRERLRVFAAAAPAESQLKAAAELALAGSDAVVAEFWNTGYLAAAKADAAAREQYLKDLEARNKAAEDLSDLAQQAQRASAARTRLLAAHGEAVRALQQAANAMGGAANAARHAERVLTTGTGTAAAKAIELNAAKTQTTNELHAAEDAAEQASVAAGIASTAADDLIDTGLTYGAEWSLIVNGMSEASAAAVGAATTALNAIDATIATNNAQDAQAKAEAHAAQAEKWLKLAKDHAAAAEKLAAAAAKQAAAAKTAAARTKAARIKAQAAEAKAEAAAARAHQHRLTAEAEAETARQQRIIAERERANAAAARQRAEDQAAVASSARGNADAQAATARSARLRSDAAAESARTSKNRAWDQEAVAQDARDDALAAERQAQTATAKASALRSHAAAQASGAERDEAQRQADEADRQAGIAGTAAHSARASANTATGAAANSRAAADQAEQAAVRAWAAAQAAEAAARRADAAADAAEADARAAHSARMQAESSAAEATRQEIKAAESAQAAVRLAEQAADEAVQSLWAANRTRDEAQAATTEAVAASAQAEIAVTAAAAARQSAAGIADPANAAVGMVAPFTGDDIDADFVTEVAEQARTIGAEQAAAAQQRATEALAAAKAAGDAAGAANDLVKPAFLAASQAAAAAADAAKSAAEARQYAADAAADGAQARAAAVNAANADDQARADAAAARQAANRAASDAAIAGRNAQAAQADADAAKKAATAAEADAAAARQSATQAESDATAARTSADKAQAFADDADKAVASAMQSAVEAQQAYERAEAAERAREQQEFADGEELDPAEEQNVLDGLSPADQELYKQYKNDSGQGIIDFIQANAGDLIMSLLGLDDLKACFIDGNVTACLWTLVNLIPAEKLALSGFKLVEDIARLIPKAEKFLDKVKDAKKKLDELKNLARRNQTCSIVPLSASTFAAGTQVLRANGTTASIESLRVGDLVMSSDPHTGATSSEPITAVHTQQDLELADVTVIGANGRNAVLHTTEHHPFWSADRRVWINASDLHDGEHLVSSDGDKITVRSVREFNRPQKMHDLTVRDTHTFFVAVGDATVLVHNAGGSKRKYFDFGDGYSGGLDTWPGSPDFEIHVYYKGNEVGIFGSEGFFNKHGKSADSEIPKAQYDKLKGVAIDHMRRSGRLGPKGTEDVTGDNWKKPRCK